MTVLRPAVVLFALLTALTGVAYPLGVTAVAALVFPDARAGSLVRVGDTVVGSSLIGQSFTAARYFWGRPSAVGHDASTSGGSQLGPTNPALVEAVGARVAAVRVGEAPVPADLVTMSGSGLDPHLSPAGAYAQVARVAAARRLDEARVRAVVDAHVEDRTMGFLGEPRVNVLMLNLALDAVK